MPAVTERPVEVRAVPQQPGTAPAARTGAQRLAIIAEALAAAALVTAAAATAFTNHDTGPPGRGVGPPVTAGAGAVSPSPDRRVPPPVGWAIVGAYRVPVSATLGPAVVADGLARGFARTTTAAVIAAANIAARTTPEAGPEVFTATIEAQVFDPKGDAFSRAVTAGYQRRHHTGTHGKDPPARLRIATVARVPHRSDRTRHTRPRAVPHRRGAAPAAALTAPRLPGPAAAGPVALPRLAAVPATPQQLDIGDDPGSTAQPVRPVQLNKPPPLDALRGQPAGSGEASRAITEQRAGRPCAR